jgi:biopolymer transport protein ExbD
MHDPSQEGETSETETINVVPLADLTLVLLVILMVVSPMISQSMIHVAAPSIKSDKAEDKPKDEPKDNEKPPEPLMIGITASGYSLNNTKADSLETVVNAVAARLTEEPKRAVLVAAEDDITVGAIVEVLDSVKVMEPLIAQSVADREPDFKIKISLVKKAAEGK